MMHERRYITLNPFNLFSNKGKMLSHILMILLCLLAAAFATNATAQSSKAQSHETPLSHATHTTSGPQTGVLSTVVGDDGTSLTARVWRGIPYAEAPTGDLRWYVMQLYVTLFVSHLTAYTNLTTITAM
jgi:hypothetical protein